MKVAYSWLKKYVSIHESIQVIAERLTLSGLEVEDISRYETLPNNLNGVIVAQVVACEKHPNADKLKKCKVNTGNEILDVVCGAPNVQQGQKVFFATVGTTLHPLNQQPISLKAAKIRGEMSYGMICAEDELGLGSSHDGIMVLPDNAPVGIPAAEYLQLYHDDVLEIAITPNRTDALSHFGVARELAALFKLPYTFPTVAFKPSFPCPVTVKVENAEDCPLYAGLVIRNVKIQPSPKWLQNLLLSVSQKPINNVVDVTNYVMLGLGQPLHAFDLNAIHNHQVIVRRSKPDETFTALDQKNYTLTGNEQVISNPKEAMCLAGVMGGLNSGINSNTTDIFLEAAYFDPTRTRIASQKTTLRSESSYRFERGIDPNRVLDCLKIAADLIQQLAGGDYSDVITVGQTFFPPKNLTFSIPKANSFIGNAISSQTYYEIFKALEYEPEKISENELLLHIPAYRHDVTRFQDTLEDFLRIYGLNEVQNPEHFTLPATPPQLRSDYALQNHIANDLAAKGWYEIETNPLVHQKFTNPLTVKIKNFLSEENAHLRTTLLWGGLNAIAYNLNRQQHSLRFFEIAKVYLHQNGTYLEPTHLALWQTGYQFPYSWTFPKQKASPLEIIALVTSYFERYSVPFEKIPFNEPTDHFDYGMNFIHTPDKSLIAQVGSVKNEHLKASDIKQEVFFGYLLWDLLASYLVKPQKPYKPVPKFPFVKRDISLFVEPHIAYQDLKKCILQTNPKLIRQIELFDIYENKQAQQKSYAISLIFQDETQTLTDETVDNLMQTIFDKLEQMNGITLRKS